MQLNKNFEYRDICGAKALLPIGLEHVDFNSIISLNETAAYIYNTFIDKTFTLDDVLDALESEYSEGFVREQAISDIESLFAEFRKLGILED